ncbi:unnamed protein product [Mytilus coruscus]|uniref:C1q domain-containing protein n=1 Tax=Mytilus coruscus TaxID=42192 RepID=A0A6J7ZW34_MYTCO|nr:unnamed protein product [Mytilus coruscus]
MHFSGTQMEEYKDCKHVDDHTYETVYSNSKITKETFSSRKLWIKIFILVMTISLVFSVLGVTVTYLVMCRELCGKPTPSNSSTTVDQQISIISKKLDKIQIKSENLTQQTKLVAFTACVIVDTTVQKGQTIKFKDVKTSVGLGNLSDSISSGIFTTKDTGLYQVIVIVKTHTDAAAFTVNRNSAILVSGYVAQHTDRGEGTNFDHMGTAVVMVFLFRGDTISVTPDIEVYLHNETCLSMVKI